MKRCAHYLFALCLACCLMIPPAAARTAPALKSGPAFFGPARIIFFGIEPDPATGRVRRYAAVIDLSLQPAGVTVHFIGDTLWEPAFSPSVGLMGLRFRQDLSAAPKGAADLIGLTLEVSEQAEIRLVEAADSVLSTRYMPVTVSVGGPEEALTLPPFSVSETDLVFSAGGVIWRKPLVAGTAVEALFPVADPNVVYDRPLMLSGGGIVCRSRRGRNRALCVWRPGMEGPANLAVLGEADPGALPSPMNRLFPALLSAFSVDPETGDVYYGAAGGLHAVSARPGAAPRQAVSADGGWVFDPRWSPDGATLAYTVAFPDGHTKVVMRDRQGERETDVSGIGRRGFMPRWSPDGSYLVWLELTTSGALDYYGCLLHVLETASGQRSTVFLTRYDSLIEGDIKLRDGLLKEAGRLYREYMQEKPASLGDDRLLEWARCLERAKMYEEAIDLYEGYIAAGSGGDASGPYVLMRLARLSIEIGDYEAARGYYRSVLNRPMSRSTRVMAMEQARKVLGGDQFSLLVDALLEEQAETDPAPDRWWRMATLLRFDDRLDEAVRLLLEAGDSAADPMVTQKQAGNLISLAAGGQRLKVIGVLTGNIRESVEESPTALLALANLHVTERRTAAALDEYERALELLDYDPAVLLPVVQVFRRLGENARALRLVERIRPSAELDDTTRYSLALNRARLCLAVGRDEEAERHLSSLMETYPNRLEAFLQLAEHHLDGGRPDRALTVLAAAPSRFRSRPAVVIRMVKIFTALERFEEAAPILRNLLPRLDGQARQDLQTLMDFLDSKTSGE